MSIFDPPKQEKLSDVFPQGTLFWLLGAQFEGVQPTSYGERVQASVTVCPVGQEQDQKQYRVWGTLAEQIAALESGDLPAEVEVAQEGRRHVWRFSKKLDHMGVQQAQVQQGEDDIPF